MPNFNGAIIVHAMQLLDSPATLREIVTNIAQYTELTHKDIKEPVKQTLEVGVRLGFLQKSNGRYYLEPITFPRLMSGMRTLSTPNTIEKPKPTVIQKIPMQKLFTIPEAKEDRSLDQDPIPKKASNDRPPKPLTLNEGTKKNKKHGDIFKSRSPVRKTSVYDKKNNATLKKKVTSCGDRAKAFKVDQMTQKHQTSNIAES